MPSYLDFNTTKKFRDVIIAKTLNVPNGPQTFTSANYIEHSLNDFPDIDPGDVTTNRDYELTKIQTSNVYKPLEYMVRESINTIPRKANLELYPDFIPGQYHNLIGILTNDNYSTESELFKFAAYNIKENPEGPVQARIRQNLYAATVGRVNLIDALQGNLATATNLLTGKQPLVDFNNKITVAKTVLGKGIDFLQTVSGVEFPWSEIPGDYLSDPRSPDAPMTTTGALGSFFGINKRSKSDIKPSDLLIDYTGNGNKHVLFDNLSFSKYAPNYTRRARSQNTNKVFNFVDNLAQGVRSILGIEAPEGVSYIGDDRSDDVKFAMGDFNDRPVRSGYYLSLMFDPVQAILFQNDKNMGEGGPIGGGLTWISSKSKNLLGANNAEYGTESSQFEQGLSTKFTFREDSLLGYTQSILETLPIDGGSSRSHVANVIDQTSRVFRDGDTVMSRGSAVKYIDKFTGEESGVEYCRVWTKDRSYSNNSDLMKRTGLIRKSDASVLTTPYNLNIYPNSNGNKDFTGSSNIVPGKDGFYAKKYMFSLENLAWKASNTPGFQFNDLPYCERGPNGGRVMWFPPYDLKINEQNSARWEENNFLGRPEPVYTYQNTSRAGTISFKVIVDHPSILNLLVRENFKGMSDEEADNYINAFFSGCEDLDFYALIRKYVTLTEDDLKRITDYLNASKPGQSITRYKSVLEPVKDSNIPEAQSTTPSGGGNGDGTTVPNQLKTIKSTLYFNNDIPKPTSSDLYGDVYENVFTQYMGGYDAYISDLENGLKTLFSYNPGWTSNQKNDEANLYGKSSTSRPDPFALTGQTVLDIFNAFSELQSTKSEYDLLLSELKTKLDQKKIQKISISLSSTTSAVADDSYNFKLSYRRSYSIIMDILNKIKKTTVPSIKWKNTNVSGTKAIESLPPIPFKSLGYDFDGEVIFGAIENTGEQMLNGTINTQKNVNCHNKEFKTSDSLKRTAPLAFYCRESTVTVQYSETADIGVKPTPAPVQGKPNPELPKVTIIQEQVPKANKKPPLDELKRIVMKVLSECYYFKKLEEDSPVAFSSLKEKLKYFHPAFHSMTPEGLNSRLTFLNQCVRPGDTIPIKGISDVNDLNARNTTFGPPPICILRIGDFYHSKVVLRDMNVTFDENIWDLNPEGIGVQPMMANVTMQVNFIGGHGLEKPVEILQNALTSNFYANTEMYDYRSTATEDKTKYTKEFLEDLLKPSPTQLVPQTDTKSSNKVIEGTYIGKLTGSVLNYDDLIANVFTTTVNYFNGHKNTMENITSFYGYKLASMFFSPIYRQVNIFDVQTGAGVLPLEILGQYKKNKELFVLSSDFGYLMDQKINDTNISILMGLDKDLGDAVVKKSEEFLKPYVKSTIKEIIDYIPNNTDIKYVEKTRNEFINNLDKLNFIVEVGYDGKKVSDNVYSGATLSGYTYPDLYEKYKTCITYTEDNFSKLMEGLDTSFMFSSSDTITDELLSEFLSILLKSSGILSVYSKDKTVFNESVMKKITKRVNKFVTQPEPIIPKISKYPSSKDGNKVEYVVSDNSYIFTDEEKRNLIKIMSSRVDLESKLNYYKP